MPEAGAGFGVYVHWPFCESKCPYCDFNSHVADSVDQARWQTAYRIELEKAAQELNHLHCTDGAVAQPVTSIFFGGGTPSLMDPETVSSILESIRDFFPVIDSAEITIEANPSSAEMARFKAYAEAGVNRVSIGVQSLYDYDLTLLGRAHDRNTALETIEAARNIFSRYSFDLIYARPDQTIEDWEVELTTAIELAGSHLSVYQLTIEPGTPFARNHVAPAEEEIAEAMYRSTQDILSSAGLPAYEISNHAEPGMEGQHNMTYWRGGAYLGVGPGSHSRLKTGQYWSAFYRLYDPVRWLESVENNRDGTAKIFSLGTKERRDEVVMMGLRLTNGISDKDFNAATGLSLDSAFTDKNLYRLVDGGFLEKEKGLLKATTEGLLRLDAVLANLLAD